MGESSKLPKSLTFKTPILKTCNMHTNIHNLNLKWSTVLDRQTENKSENL